MSITEISLFIVLTFTISLAIIRHTIKLKEEGINSVIKSQSTIHNKINSHRPRSKKIKLNTSQSKNFVSEKGIKIIEIENKAYWVKDNMFFTADMVNGKIDRDTAQEVNTMNMSKSEIDKMIFIIDKLKDDKQ